MTDTKPHYQSLSRIVVATDITHSRKGPIEFSGNDGIIFERMDKNVKDISYFISFCIEQYMKEKGMNEEEVLGTFSTCGVLEYLNEYFEILHTQSRQWLMADIEDVIQKRRKLV